MSNSSSTPWSNNPNAPQIPESLYFAEKTNFAGILIAGILYGTPTFAFVESTSSRPFPLVILGVVAILFFQCMGTLVGSVSRMSGRIRWGLVVHTVAMFSFVTIFTVVNMDLLSISYIDNRAFPGDDKAPPGPFGYQFLVYSKPINLIPYIMFFLNNWLADGLLVSPTPNSVVRLSHLFCFCSSIVAASFIP